MIGGITSASTVSQTDYSYGFVFNETGWTDKGMIFATFSGKKLESYSSYITGAQPIGEELKITKSSGDKILTIDGCNAAQIYKEGIGDKIDEDHSLAGLFPLVYSEFENIPIVIRYSDDHLCVNHNIDVGRKVRRAFLYDRKIISENRALFGRIENFEKAETIFGYSCKERASNYPNCVKWEISAYENSNICGCITDGEIVYTHGKNVFANCSFAVSVIGEKEASSQYNPYVFSHTDSLENDNRRMIDYIMDIENDRNLNGLMDSKDTLLGFIRDCEMKLLYSDKDDIPNAAAMNMDIKINGYDRVCIIDVLDTTGMGSVFSDSMIDMTHKNYVSKCLSFAKSKGYRMYLMDKWEVAIGAPSYRVSLGGFTTDMKALQRELSKVSEDLISIVSVFCVINECSIDNLKSVYNMARLEMMNKNIQFYVCDAGMNSADEDSIKEKYHMVNVINYAITNDKVIPYFQGIYDNRKKAIHHYESLMRLVDEDGVVYYPASFLDVARSFGLLYDSLSSIMIAKVFDIFKDIEDKSVSVNLSMRDIKNEELVSFIYEFLSTASHPGNFVFEILENEDVDDYEALVRFVDNIHKLGGLISIDDFGSGYSNLQHIASIHSDYIKIDGSIVRNCCKDQESENLVALISGWKSISTREVQIIAEYVENEDIQKKLNKYGIDFSQGYLFSKPSPGLN